MKKLFFGLTILILFMILVPYTLLFTKPGNNLLALYIESKINDSKNSVSFKIEDLTLTFDSLNFKANFTDGSTILILGKLEIFNKNIDLSYDIKIKELSNLEKLLDLKLNGEFYTKGTFKGDDKKALIDGFSDIANSNTSYNLNLVNFEPSTINFKVENAKIDMLLNLINQPIYAKGLLNSNAQIKNSKMGELDGVINAVISKGEIINEVINKNFDQNITSKIVFKNELIANLDKNEVHFSTNLVSNLFELLVNKSILNLKDNSINSDYRVDFPNLSEFDGIIHQKFFGKFFVDGNISIKDKKIEVSANSDIFNSDTKALVLLDNSVLSSFKIDLKDAKIDRILHTVNQPIYAYGNLFVKGEISSDSNNILNGQINTNINSGKVVNEVVNALYDLKLKDTINFNGNINTNLANNQAISNVDFKSSLANLKTEKSIFDIKTASFVSDYLVNIESLDNLKDVTSTKMRGKLDINGNVKSQKNDLLVDGNSKLLGGEMKFILNNNILDSKIENIQVKELTHMLYYPEVFDSKSSFELKYDTLSKKGNLNGNLLNGHFLPNDFSSIINQFAKFDLTKEVYEKVDINSDIDDMVLKTIINMKSKNTTIDVTNSILDLQKSTIDANIKAKILDLSFGIDVKGNTSNPKISLDSKDLLKGEINKQLEKNQDKIKEKLDNVLKDKLGDDASKNLLNNFKSLF